MSWQEELRRLDADLASGKISRHEHRKQRDELLAAASGGGITSPVAAPLARAGSQPNGWQSANPVHSTAEQPETPHPEPPPEPHPEPGPEAEPPPPAPAETTGTAADLLNSDRMTTAPSPADERSTNPIRYPAMSEAPTVITRPVVPAELPGLGPQSPRHFSGVERQPSAPIATPARGRAGTWLYLSLGVFVVLSLIVGATWFLSAHSNGSNTNTTVAPTTPVNPQLDVEGKLPDLPGTANPDNSTMSIDKAVQLRILTPEDAAKVRASGAQEIVFRGSSDTVNVDESYQLLAIPTASANDADKLVQGLRETLTGAGFMADPIGPGEAGAAYTDSNPAGRVSALWYASGTVAIGIGVSEPLTGDPATLRARLGQVRDSVSATLPPS